MLKNGGTYNPLQWAYTVNELLGLISRHPSFSGSLELHFEVGFSRAHLVGAIDFFGAGGGERGGSGSSFFFGLAQGYFSILFDRSFLIVAQVFVFGTC